MGKIGEVIEPLVIDVARLKKRYSKLAGLTSYQRANVLALESKRAAWAAYRPLEKAQLFDTADENAIITILLPTASRAPKRSTKNGALHAQTSVFHRPTETLAIFHALGLYKFDSEDPVIRQDPHNILHWCILCETFKHPDSFRHVKYSVDGLAYACNTCRNKDQQIVWKKQAA